MEQNLDFANVGFYFAPGECAEGLADDKARKLTVMFHEEEIHPYMGSFSEDVLRRAKDLAVDSGAGLENLTVERGDGLDVNILENGEKVASFGFEVHVPADDYEKIMPNGREASDLEYYTEWSEFDALEAIVREQDNQFGAAVGSIGQETGMEQE